MSRVATATQTRLERDLLGDRQVPIDAYYGVHTLRATENFSITGTPISTYPELVHGLVAVKAAAAEANFELGLLSRPVADAIKAACQEILSGQLHEHFVVDVIQGGAGTSTNMNVNEVVANRALEHLGKQRGEYQFLHPVEHVNMSQSTNDAYPTAIKVGLWLALADLQQALTHLRTAFAANAEKFAAVIKMGRTQLQDAVPMTLGQEFGTYAVMLGEDQDRLHEVAGLLPVVNLGGTAIGTGINASPRYAELAVAALARISGVPVVPAADLIAATQDTGELVQLSGVLKRAALKLSKICHDLRLLSSGPRAGLNEINLPPVQAGSSIMPGKINPVIPEVVNQVAYAIAGRDLTIAFAAEAGQLQLNAFEPVMAHSLFASIRELAAASRTLADRCVVGITTNADRLRGYVDESIGLTTALNPHIGYHASTAIAADALASGRTVIELVLDRGLLTEQQVREILRPENLIWGVQRGEEEPTAVAATEPS